MITDNQIIRYIFGFKVRHLRQKLDLSYQELAKLTGLSTSYLHDIEKGKRYPKPNKINVLAEALKVDYNYMVATNASKKLQPIIDLLNSKFFKLFPLEDFGISMEKLLELFTHTPDKVNAFISTIFKIARNYQVEEAAFYKEALRSYQDMHNNHFPEIEDAAAAFKQEFSIKEPLPFVQSYLEDQLFELYGIKVDKTSLAKVPNLKGIRSYFDEAKLVLHIQKGLSEAQNMFLIGRELGFQYLKISERPKITTIMKVPSFEQLLNNYKASHFAAALLMDEHQLTADLRNLARENSWNSSLINSLLEKYNVTGEMLLQRLTNILPNHFGISDLFFMRMTSNEDLSSFKMNKDLHLSQLHSPYNNGLKEHFCNRWVAITSIRQFKEAVKKDSKTEVLVDAQISQYWNTNKSYFCISIAKPSFSNPHIIVSVTIGLLITAHVKSIFHCITDPKLKTRMVHTTCERCGITDCESRLAPPTWIELKKKEEEVLDNLRQL